LPFSRLDDLLTGDGPNVENARVCFVWEDVACTGDPARWEFLAYVC
jgi:hypothetical protein